MTIEQIVEERGNKYGHPNENFRRTANILNEMNFRIYDPKDNTYRMMEAKDIPIMMICVKMAREAHCHNDDNLVDIEGYKKTYYMLEEQLFS